MHAVSALGYLAKLKRGLGLTFGAHLLHDFFIKMFRTLSMDKVSMSNLVSFSTYRTKCVIKFLFTQMMTSSILKFFLNQPLKQWLTGKKEGKTKTQKFEYLENERAFKMK